MRRRDVVIRLRGARFDQAQPELVADVVRACARVIEDANPGSRVKFSACNASAIRLTVTHAPNSPRDTAA